MMQTKRTLFIVGFAVAAVCLLPLTCLWALVAGLGGDRYPLFIMRGKTTTEPLDTDKRK